MEITDLSIHPFTNLYPLVAQCNATIDHCMHLKNITIRQAKKGIYVLFPKSISLLKRAFASSFFPSLINANPW